MTDAEQARIPRSLAANLQHRFVAGIHARKELEYVVQQANGYRFERLHLAQGNEEICGPLALLQATLVLCGWPRSRVVNRYPERGPLRTFWQRVRELYDIGTDERDLSSLAGLLAPHIGIEAMKFTSPKRIGLAATEAIEAGHIPIVRLTGATASHWATVVGAECSTNGAVLALLLLDTSAEPPRTTFFNARLELVSDPKARKPFVLTVSYAGSKPWRAHLESLFVVKRGHAPEQP